MAKFQDGNYGTAAGVTLIAKVLAGRCTLKYTRAAVGKGAIPDGSTPKTMTGPADYVMDVPISGVTNPVDGECQVSVQVSSTNVQTGFYCTNVVLYAQDPDVGEVPFTYLVLENEPEWIHPASSSVGKVTAIDLISAVGDVDRVEAIIDENTIATIKAVAELIKEHDKDPNAHVDVISAALSAAIKKLEDSGQIMDEKAAKKFVREMLDQYGAAKDISFEDTYETGASNLQEALDKVLGSTLPKLTVTTTAGSSLTITDGKSTITGTADSGGSYTVALPRMGLWTVTASLAGLTTDDTVTVDVVGGKYTLTLPYFAATLNVTTAPDAVVTATLSTGKAYTATADSSGSATVRIKRSGTYTVQATKGDAKSDTAEVEITENGEAYAATVHFCVLTLTAPVGSTLTATCGDSTMTATVTGDGETGTVKLYPPVLGTWSITATKDDEATTETVAATAYKDYALELAYVRIYGVVWDKTSKTTLSRTDDAALFADPTPALSGKGGNSPFDNCLPWSGMVKETRTGGVMVKIPKFWFKWTAEGGKLKLQIADRKAAGFSVSPAHADRGDGKGERDYVYIGRYKCASDYKSKSGVSPKTNITRDAFRSGIHALGSTIWQQDFAMFWTIRMLYLVEFADWDGQKVIGFNCGNGSNVQTMGTTDSMTYHTGTMQSSRSTYGVGVQYRWIEDPWGNALEWCDGIYFSGSGVYCIKTPANFSDGSGGTKVGSRPTSDGYISDWSVPTASGFEYALYPSAVNGSETTYIADYCYYDGVGVVLFVGGGYNQVRNRGPFCLIGSYAAWGSHTNIGSRLQELP